jgi:hypothetical protein
MGLAKDQEGYILPRRFIDLEKWDNTLYEHTGTKWSAPRDAQTPHEVMVSTGGPYKGGLAIPEGASGWNAGDIDFRSDGAIFIRNPYLADAMERHLQAAFDRAKKKGEKTFLKIVRDEGWSGTQSNIVC